jgi:hypothetical protein
MGCCQTNKLETEVDFTQINTLPQLDCEDKFNEISLSSHSSPLKFAIIQEELQYSSMRISYETTNFSNNPYTKLSLEMAFVCGRS